MVTANVREFTRVPGLMVENWGLPGEQLPTNEGTLA
jgi:hypothetical protein